MTMISFVGLLSAVLAIYNVDLISGQVTYASTVQITHPMINQTSTYASSLGLRTWIDTSLPFTGGRVVSFFASICPVGTQSSYYVRFQIWISLSSSSFLLLYEQRQQIANNQTYLQVNVPYTVSLAVPSSARLGWTFEDSAAVICSTLTDSYGTLQSNVISNGQYPVINQTITISAIPYPVMFAVGVQIDTQLPGATGGTGATGPVGATGPPGATGPIGPTGNTGPVGAAGPSGGPGATGPPGRNGVTGAVGATGWSGPVGGTGPPGPSGQTGATGLQGLPGPNGRQGDTGGSGPPGPSGAPGPTGQIGPPGIAGSTGLVGAMGATGASGASGAPGVSGASGATGPIGPIGATGQVGPVGEPGIAGATGAKGDRGDPGPAGPQGPPGAAVGNAVVNYCANASCSWSCINLASTYQCQCQTGYQLDANGLTCSDVNECATNNGGCQQLCSNNQGSFTCSCRSGYQLAPNNINCLDIDECAAGAVGTTYCGQLCVNTDGSFRCSCNEGYVLNSDSRTCSDFNECSVDNGGCDTYCTNTIGSFTCSCKTGFTLAPNNFECIDIDECKTTTCTMLCINTPGSFKCIQLSLFSGLHADPPLAVASKTSAETTPSSAGVYVAWLIVLTVIVACLLAAVAFHFRSQMKQRQRSAEITDCDDGFSVDDFDVESDDQIKDDAVMTTSFGSAGSWPSVDVQKTAN